MSVAMTVEDYTILSQILRAPHYLKVMGYYHPEINGDLDRQEMRVSRLGDIIQRCLVLIFKNCTLRDLLEELDMVIAKSIDILSLEYPVGDESDCHVMTILCWADGLITWNHIVYDDWRNSVKFKHVDLCLYLDDVLKYSVDTGRFIGCVSLGCCLHDLNLSNRQQVLIGESDHPESPE